MSPFPFCNNAKTSDLHAEKFPTEWDARGFSLLAFNAVVESKASRYPLGMQGFIIIPSPELETANLTESLQQPKMFNSNK